MMQNYLSKLFAKKYGLIRLFVGKLRTKIKDFTLKLQKIFCNP